MGMQRLLLACCCLLALGLATRAAGLSDENAVEEAEKSQAVNSDITTNLRNIRAADPDKKDKNKPRQEKKKKREKKKKGKKISKKKGVQKKKGQKKKRRKARKRIHQKTKTNQKRERRSKRPKRPKRRTETVGTKILQRKRKRSPTIVKMGMRNVRRGKSLEKSRNRKRR